MPEILESVFNFVFPKDSGVRDLELLTAEDLRSKLPKAKLYKDNSIALFDYQDEDVRRIIWEIKYNKNKQLAFTCAELLAEELLDFMREKKQFYPKAKFILLPVPVSDKRRKRRGYNQTELVADCIKKMLPSIHYCKQTIRRDMDRTSQTKKTKTEREKNVSGCFSLINTSHIKDNIVIVLDDVTTTGATLDEIEKQISKYAPKEFLRLTISH